MSIPPLVCSTPPPPDQCEDDNDKHIDEFDLQYRLSPEDDDENDEYNYGNFSNFNSFSHTVTKNNDSEEQNVISTLKTDQSSIENTKNSDNRSSNDNIIEKVIFDDVAIEDLNLKIEQESDLVDQVISNISNEDTNSDIYGITCYDPQTESPNHTELVIEENQEDNKAENSLQEVNDHSLFSKSGQESPLEFVDQSETVPNDVLPENISSQCGEANPDLNTCDDFDEFEDFKFTTDNTFNTVESSGNPWESNEPEDFTFGDFKANFDANEIKFEESNEDDPNNKIIDNNADCKNETDDDFGDFDDFKSSIKEECMEEPPSPHVAVLNFQSNDNESQIIESIKNILFNIFEEDLPEPGMLFDKNIETMLGEAWHHLKEVDDRQPYIVCWNNSLGQKTLLKALCIDSRNILFGPKWNSMMPKYATTLSGAPLKPQKPSTPTTIQQPELNTENTKETVAWTDPFSASGQESNNADREKTFKDSRPSDLDIFGNSITVSKLDTIHSSTLSVQPLRHINLPDTHIFTPTDSETPRSKTIHYDTRPSVLIPQTTDEHNVALETSPTKTINIENNDDYWEFQDFKGTNETVQNVDVSPKETITPIVNSIPTNSAINVQSQLLQPVKVEPVIPTLNWPDPGEVKETFDDFSDFMSSNHWNNDNSNADNTGAKPSPNSHLEDDFETFQSAPAPTHIKLDVEASSLGPSKLSNDIQNIPLDTFALNDTLTTQNHNVAKKVPAHSNSSPVNTSILKPISSGPSVIRPQHGQILQPLFLESYSQINWPKPGIDLQNLSSFNPLESLDSLKTESGSSGTSKGASPVHRMTSGQSEALDDDIWGDFVSSKPKPAPKKSQPFPDEDEWTDFVSSPSLSHNSLKTISFNVESNSTLQKNSTQSVSKNNKALDIPVLNYITPKSSSRSMCADKHFQNL